MYMINLQKREFNIKAKKLDLDTFVVFFLTLRYIISIVNQTVRHFIGNTNKLDTIVIYGALFFVFVMVLPQVWDKLRVWQLLGILIVFLYLGVGTQISSDGETYSLVLEGFLTECVPFFFCGVFICDYGNVRDKLIRVMTIIPYCYLFMLMLLGLNMLDPDATYSQPDSYKMLFLAVVLTSALFEKFSIKYLIPLCISMFFMIAYGARGPLVCWGLFVILQLMIQLKRLTVIKRFFIAVCIGIAVIVLYNNYYSFLLMLQTQFERMGFSVRVVNRLLDNNFLIDVGRNNITSICLERIKYNPVLGTGPVNDRIYIAEHLGGGADAYGNYPHNIFTEIIMQYGIFIGGAILIAIIWMIVKAYRTVQDIQSKNFIIILIGTYLFPLLFSGSYVDSRGFYLLVAVCVTIIINKKNAVRNV